MMKKPSDHGRTLLLASMSLPSARQLSALAEAKRWKVRALDEPGDLAVSGPRTFYGGSDRAPEYAARFELCLIEPPLDLLARMPADLLARRVRFGSLCEFTGSGGPIFVKPADPVLRCFDAGVYRSVSEVRGRRPIDGSIPILVSEPVEWTSEFRLFILNGKIAAWSPYLSFGRPVWKPGSAATGVPSSLTAFCERMFGPMPSCLPPAFVMDVGVLEDGRWAIVEFNPAWCSGILGANVEAVFRVIERAAMWLTMASEQDRRWVRLTPNPIP